MSVEASERIAPKSILRHRPIGEDASSTPTRDATLPPVAVRASRTHAIDEASDIREWRCADTIATRPKTPAQKHPKLQRHAKPSLLGKIPKVARPMLPRKSAARLRSQPLVYLGLGMVAMLCLWMAMSALVGWVHTGIDDVRYGRPRTVQMDAWVGHNEQNGMPSHFLAINLHGHIEVIELAGSDPSSTRIYNGPQLYGPNADLIPVTLQFADVNGDHKPDMIITVNGSHMVLINAQGKFRPLLPSERPQVGRVVHPLI